MEQDAKIISFIDSLIFIMPRGHLVIGGAGAGRPVFNGNVFLGVKIKTNRIKPMNQHQDVERGIKPKNQHLKTALS